MTKAGAKGAERETPSTVSLEDRARSLAEEQRAVVARPESRRRCFRPPSHGADLERAYGYLAATSPSSSLLSKTSEWYLDNYYLIRRVARQIEHDLPPGFVRRLPLLAAGDGAGEPRVRRISEVIVRATEMMLDASVLVRFVAAYQERSPLSIAELWALPTMLRTAVLGQLIAFLHELGLPRAGEHVLLPFLERPQPLEAGIPSLGMEPGRGVESSIRALRVLDVIDWKTFFAATSRVEATLRTDPAGVYAEMDFETCDAYRKVVEELAWDAAQDEDAVAGMAVALATASVRDEQRGHVGYYLVGAGRRGLEAHVGYSPHGVEWVRRQVCAHPTVTYLLAAAFLTWLPVSVFGAYLVRLEGHALLRQLLVVLAACALSIPALGPALEFVQFAFARLLVPRTLPKLDFRKGLPASSRTLVVIPTLLGCHEDVAAMIRQIELHYLSNPDPELRFALLTDDMDSALLGGEGAHSALSDEAGAAITALNAKHEREGIGPFHLLHRARQWNPSEQRYMGWERKRGKLEELNRLLRGDTTTSYARHVGAAQGLTGIRFVITLDSDTELPMESAHRLVGLLSHPLNRAVFDGDTGRVLGGYTIVQPRIATSPSTARSTVFSKLFAGDVGFDIYTHACSELYQDLFGSGIYVGKGIYEVDGFIRSTAGCAPENALVSHDLFEGVHGRTALATDIVLYESFPPTYAAFARRMHRWARGDWQLLPWLLSMVPSTKGPRLRNRLSFIDRWKIADNLRRSISGAVLFALLVLGWSELPGGPLLWTSACVAVVLAPSVFALVRRPSSRPMPLLRALLAVAFLPYEAFVVLDAVARVAVRKLVTRRHLLQWTTAAHVAYGLESKGGRALYWQTMVSSPLAATALTGLLAITRPAGIAVAWPLLLAWFFAPEIAHAVSRATVVEEEGLDESERRALRLLARRTWRFFDAFVGPGDQWLPIDNYQEAPREQIAHRTSPTNVGLMLTATLSAYDFGYIGPTELSLRVRRTFDSLGRMQHCQGHLFNWYDTKNLEPLLPRYVSTVDSGNFAGCLIALKQGCEEVAVAHVLRKEAWEGLRDSLDLLEEVVGTQQAAGLLPLRSVIASMREITVSAEANLEGAHPSLMYLCEEGVASLNRELLAFLERGDSRHEADLLRALRTSAESLHQQLQQMKREEISLLPWLFLSAEADAHALPLPMNLRLSEIPAACVRLRATLAASEAARRERGEESATRDLSARQLDEAFRVADENAAALCCELRAIAVRADAEVRGMDFKLLYDRERRLLHIGYNATVDQIDPHYYDLLASEARLASYLAIVKRDVPESHWYALGRPMTQAHDGFGLISWGGTMFEYLMPHLLMRSQEGTLLARTSEFAVESQMAFGKKRGEPWGVSESAYARVDAAETYQYRSFGVPCLGFKRGLDDDRVVAPYASVLAVSLRPRAVLENVRVLESLGMRGTYGLFEALDFTEGHHVPGSPREGTRTVVRSYMAHHQGMLLVALGNYLNRRSMSDRFHSDTIVESGAILLNEHAPQSAPREWRVAKVSSPQPTLGHVAPPAPPPPWRPLDSARSQAFVLSNDRLTSLVTTSGGGGLSWHGLAITRFAPDATHDTDGIWIFVRDEESGEVWRATQAEGTTVFAANKAAFHLRAHGISVHLDVTVAADDDAELRQVTLHNETDRPRSLTVTSVGRPVLFEARRVAAHPAFVSMFVESEWLGELEGLLFARRPQSSEGAPAVLVHRVVCDGGGVSLAGYESDRCDFTGRATGTDTPESIRQGVVSRCGRVGAVIDPVMSVTVRAALAAKGSATLAFVTTVARSRTRAVDLARKYGSMHAIRWAFRDAEQASGRRLLRSKIDPALLPAVQQLFSAILYVDPTLRAPSDVRAKGAACQRRLWGLGISGDDPIVVLRVHDSEAPLLCEALAAQRYLRSCGVSIDLVLIDEAPSGYITEGPKTVRAVVGENDGSDWIERHGGIFIVSADRTSADDLQHLESAAHVVLSTREHSLAVCVHRVVDTPPKLPMFEPTLAVFVDDSRRDRLPLLLENEFGGFSEDGREYVIELAAGASTPAPWCNVLANPRFGCLISESSFGATWSENSGENRLTPWRNDSVRDTPSEALYLRDEETGAIWSPTPLPAGRASATGVRHGAGYTVYERESDGLVQTLTVFVPHGAPLKVARLRLRNKLARQRRLTATYYAEWVLGSLRELQRPHITTEFDREHACLLARTSWNQEFQGRVAFLASKDAVHGFTSDRTEFLGRRGDYARPEALERWGLSRRTDRGSDPCAALQVHLELGPGEELETHFVLGQTGSREEAMALVARFRESAAVAAAWTELGSFWDGILGIVQVKTPELAMDLMLNRWLLYQAISARIFGRSGFYQSSGAFGYRDQLQDVLALLHVSPAIARAHILEAAKHQFEEGDVLHWWHPPSGRGVRTRCSDDMAWLPYVTSEYVDATGDVGVLEELVPFLRAPPLRADERDRYAEYEASPESGSLFAHCRKALERSVTAGAHGLPLMQDGDWNDGMSRVGAEGRGESVWLGWFLSASMDRFGSMATRTGEAALGVEWGARAKALRGAVRAGAWDGSWYLRAFHDDGSLVGSATSDACRIDSIAQSWAVMVETAGEGPDARARIAVTSADEQLVRESQRLVLLFTPPFDTPLHDPGYVRGYPPGVRENGGQYTHASTWLGFAHAGLRDGRSAERIFRLLNPALRGAVSGGTALYRVEPYVLAGDIYGAPPWEGRGGWTWYTGAASWMWRLGVEAILGIRVKDGHLSIDPCIPPTWPKFEAWVQSGTSRIHIVVENPQGVGEGIAEMTLDGVTLDGTVVRIGADSSGAREVRVRLGA